MNKTQKIVATTAIAIGTASIAIPANADSWDVVAQCESSGNWHNHDTGHTGHYGGLQFDNSSWAAAGGLKYAPRADLATKAQQKAVANVWVRIAGSGAWQCPGARDTGSTASRHSTGSYSAEQRSSVQKAPEKTYKAPEKVQRAPKNTAHTTFTYRVKEGDTLSFIGWYFNEDWHKIYKVNKKVIGSNPNLIYPGEVLTITVNY